MSITNSVISMRHPERFETMWLAVSAHRHVYQVTSDNTMDSLEVPVLTHEQAMERLSVCGRITRVESYMDDSGYNVLRGFVESDDGIQHCFYMVFDVLYQPIVDAQVAAIKYTKLMASEPPVLETPEEIEF